MTHNHQAPETPDTPAGKRQWYEQLSIVSVLILILSLALLWVHHHLGHREGYEYLSTLAKEAGFAGLVALFLNLSIEWVNRRKHAEQESALVNVLDAKHQERIENLLETLDQKYEETTNGLLKSLFRTVYNRNIDEGVFKIVEDHVLKKDLMRKRYKFSIVIRPLKDQEDTDLVDLTFDIQFDAVNISNTTYDGPLLGTTIDVTPEHEDECRFLKASIGNVVYEGESLDKLVEKDKDGSTWLLKIAGTVGVGEQVPVTLRYKKVGRRVYTEVICSIVQMDGIEVDVLSMAKSLSFNAVSLHPEDARPTSLPKPEFMSWRLDHAVLPGQGMVVFWHPTRTQKTDVGGEAPPL